MSIWSWVLLFPSKYSEKPQKINQRATTTVHRWLNSLLCSLGGRREPEKKRLAGPHRQGREVGKRLWLWGKIRRQLREGTRLSSKYTFPPWPEASSWGLAETEERGWCWQNAGDYFHACSTMYIYMHANQSPRINLEDCEKNNSCLTPLITDSSSSPLQHLVGFALLHIHCKVWVALLCSVLLGFNVVFCASELLFSPSYTTLFHGS